MDPPVLVEMEEDVNQTDSDEPVLIELEEEVLCDEGLDWKLDETSVHATPRPCFDASLEMEVDCSVTPVQNPQWTEDSSKAVSSFRNYSEDDEQHGRSHTMVQWRLSHTWFTSDSVSHFDSFLRRHIYPGAEVDDWGCSEPDDVAERLESSGLDPDNPTTSGADPRVRSREQTPGIQRLRPTAYASVLRNAGESLEFSSGDDSDSLTDTDSVTIRDTETSAVPVIRVGKFLVV
jgi:hypothetical protein